MMDAIQLQMTIAGFMWWKTQLANVKLALGSLIVQHPVSVEVQLTV